MVAVDCWEESRTQRGQALVLAAAAELVEGIELGSYSQTMQMHPGHQTRSAMEPVVAIQEQ